MSMKPIHTNSMILKITSKAYIVLAKIKEDQPN